MQIRVIDGEFAVCKLSTAADMDFSGEFVFAAKTDEELSLVCKTEQVPSGCIACEKGWRAMRIEGVLDFSLTGVISSLSSALAKQKIAVFVVSTFNTDYILVKEHLLSGAISALTEKGCEFTL